MNLAQVTNPILPPALNPKGTGDPATTGFGDKGAITQFGSIISIIVQVFLIAGSLFFVFVFIIGAIRWIMSGGDKAQIESARGTILNAVVGLIILFSLFAIVGVVDRLFGFNILQINFDLLKIK